MKHCCRRNCRSVTAELERFCILGSLTYFIFCNPCIGWGTYSVLSRNGQVLIKPSSILCSSHSPYYTWCLLFYSARTQTAILVVFAEEFYVHKHSLQSFTPGVWKIILHYSRKKTFT
jgi:hypothetical protein